MCTTTKASPKRGSESSRVAPACVKTSRSSGDAPPPVDEVVVERSITYGLSCKACANADVLTYVGTTSGDLKSAVPVHVNELYQAIVVGGDVTSIESEFGRSPLAQHIITDHCMNVTSKKDVLNWWKGNVAIRIQTHRYEKRPEAEGQFNYVNKEDALPEFVKQKQKKELEYDASKKRLEEQTQQKVLQGNALANEDCFDVIWHNKYDELKQFAAENDGSTNVPQQYPPSPLLAKWVENQRLGYRRKHNVRPKLELEACGTKAALSDKKELLLNEIRFAWYGVAKQRWDERGIAVMYGLLESDGGE